MNFQTMSPLSDDAIKQSSSISRRPTNYKPSLWSDHYIQSLPDSSLDATQIDIWEKLKEEVRHLILDRENDSINLLELIDVLCQLGVSYHFESEINNTLSYISSSLENIIGKLEKNIYNFALLFRLLREYGIKNQNISINILLNSVKTECGNFKSDIINDVRGMLSLYQASYLVIEGEDELDEAREFTIKHLRNYLKEPSTLNSQLVEEIEYALEGPIHWRIPRQHARWFIDSYEKQDNKNSKLLNFAKLDYNMLQSLYKKELKQWSKWWEDLELIGDEISFTRDRLVENYLWGLGCTFEPQFWRCREMLSKFGILITVIDDIYDIYGFLEELKLFTQSVDDWKIITQLPDYMRKTLKSLFDTVEIMAFEVLSKNGLDILPILKRLWRDQCRSYLVEAIWYYSKYTPTLNEYMENGWVSITVAMLTVSAYCLSESLTKEALDRIEYYSDGVRYASILNRLYNDLETSSDELQKDDVPKAVQCHMKEANVSESIARNYILNLIENNWKLLNGEYYADFKVEESYRKYLVNLPRTTREVYLHGDGYGKAHHLIRNMTKALVYDPIPL